MRFVRFASAGADEKERQSSRRQHSKRLSTGLATLAAFALVVGLPVSPAQAAIPTPGSSESVVSVRVGGVRTGTTAVTPLSGATLGLFNNLNDAQPVNQTWALCTSDAQGDCSFVVPNTNSGGANRDRQMFVKAVSAPTGYHFESSLGTGSNTISSTTYGFRVGRVISDDFAQLRGGTTYTSLPTGPGDEADFMLGTGAGVRNSGGVFQFVRDNPPAVQQCGIDIALVLDLSGSVLGSQNQLAGAASTLVDALTGTNSTVSLYTFSTGSPATEWDDGNTNNVLVPNHPEQQSVSTPAGASVVKAWYSNPNGTANFTPSGGTNWDRGLWSVPASGNDYDVAVILTDGNPTFYNQPQQGTGSDTRFRELENGIFSANAIKAADTRVVAVGVGAGVTSPASGLNLKAISGPTLDSDYFQTANYENAGQALRAMALAQCEGTVTLVKQVVPANTQGEDTTGATVAGGWTFDAVSSNPNVTVPASGVTSNATGAVNFPLSFAVGASTDLTFTEQLQDGYNLVTQGGKNAVCTELMSGNPVPVTNSGALGFTLSGVTGGASITCTVYNREKAPDPASIVVNKTWMINGVSYPEGAQPTGFSATLSLSGPAGGPSNQPWGSARAGYLDGDTSEINESTVISPELTECTFVGLSLADSNGIVLSTQLPHTVELDAGTNSYTITNTVTCVSRLTLLKTVVGGDASPDDWTLTAYTTPADPNDGQPVFAGTSGVTAEVTAEGTYQLAESDGPAVYRQDDNRTNIQDRPLSSGSWSCIQVDDNMNPVPDSTYNDGLNGGATVPLGFHVACAATNRTAEMSLLKYVDNQHGGSLEPDAWDLTGTPSAGVGGLSPTTVVGALKVADANTFLVRPDHSYSIEESSPSAPYLQEAVQRYLGIVGPDGSVDHTDPALWQTVDPSALELQPGEFAVFRFVNADIAALSLPLTGGTGAEPYVTTGLLLLLLAAATTGTTVWFVRRRRLT